LPLGIKNNYICSKKSDMGTLAFRFNDVVEKIYSLPLEDKLELKNLLERNISEERRNEIVANLKKSKEEHQSGKLKFSSKLDELKKML
jgi:RNAse (barnase) inhibitor barstar